MNPLTNCKNIYFIGIGGIGMSALARYFNTQGVVVSGYDKTPTLLTDALVEEGIQIHFEDDLAKIDKAATVIVYTPAATPLNVLPGCVGPPFKEYTYGGVPPLADTVIVPSKTPAQLASVCEVVWLTAVG